MAAANNQPFGGYDFETRSGTIYECLICKKIIKQFTELPCEHFSCRSCLENWENQKRINHEQQQIYGSHDEQ